jgi:hypothetical protein
MPDLERRNPDLAKQRDRIDRLYLIYRRAAIALGVGVIVVVVTFILAFVRIGRVVQAQQDARYRTLLTSCRDQNMRNARTVVRLDTALRLREAAASSPAERRRLVASRQFTVGLIDALAPHRPDCVTYAHSSLRP